MSTEISKDRHVVVMKSRVPLFVDEETATRMQSALVGQEAHRFVRIASLGVTVNTAEIEGVYTPEKYEELVRAAGGEYRCARGAWHKRSSRCECPDPARLRDRCERAMAHYREYGSYPLWAPSTAEIARTLGVERMKEAVGATL